MFILNVKSPGGKHSAHLLEKGELVVGRSAPSTLILEDEALSRRHLRFSVVEGQLMAEDLNSHNGTEVNGKRISGLSPLKAGDVVRIAGSTIEVETVNPLAVSGGHTLTLHRNVLDAPSLGNPRTLAGHASQLSQLFDLHKVLSAALDRDSLLAAAADFILRHLHPQEVALFLRTTSDGSLLTLSRSLPGRPAEFPYSRTLFEEVAGKNHGVLILDLRTDTRFSSADSLRHSGVRSVAAAPLLGHNGAPGMVVLSSRLHARQFSEEDLELLLSLCSIVSLHLEKSVLTQEVVKLRDFEKELALARRIQLALQGESVPDIPGMEFFLRNDPARGMSGDYCEVFKRNDDECVVVVTDVAGKGLGPSLLTALIGALCVGAIEDNLPSDEICSRIALALYNRTPPEKYATGIVLTIDRAGTLTYTNAGHNPALLCTGAGEAVELGPTGKPLGILPDQLYETRVMQIAPGDILVLYTDGVTEALSEEDEEYGLPRLVAVCLANHNLPIRDLVDRIDEDQKQFIGAKPFGDDRTLVIVRKLG